MVKVTCQHSGIEFEADSKRTKQHPRIAAIKSEANKRGNYREVNAALDAVRKAGGYTTIAEYMAMVDLYLKGKSAERDAAAAKRREQEQRDEEERAIARQRREEQNALLKANGYRWSKTEIGTEGGFSYGAGIGEFSHYEWILWSPDNRVVSVAQALDEIERGMEVVKAERAAKAAAERAEREAAERAAAEREAAYKAVENQAKSLPEVERFSADEREESEEIIRYRAGQWGELRVITRCKVRDVACYIVSRYGDMDYSWYYCADPQKAGLVVKQPE